MYNLPPIVVAEDDDDDFSLFRRAARLAGVENPIIRFRDGSELVRFVENDLGLPRPGDEAPMLLFVDLAMPVMSGFQVLEWLEEHAPRAFATVVLSGSKREEDMRRAFEHGAEEYLVKPLSPVLLAALAARPRHAKPARAASKSAAA